MKIRLVLSLLGAYLLQVASSKDSVNVSMSVWPTGSNIYLYDSVMLRCTVDSNFSSDWIYRWFRHMPRTTPTPNPRHLVSGERYTITAVKMEDVGSYQCQAELKEGNISVVGILSQPLVLTVSDRPLPSLTLTPSSSQVFRGERFTVQCPKFQANSSNWTLRSFPAGTAVRRGVFHTDQCSPLGGAVSADRPDSCEFTAGSENSGLYWCEGSEGRSNAISITVSFGSIILRSPASPVLQGDTVDLYCKFWTANNGKTIFFKNGVEIMTSMGSRSHREMKMRIENVTQEDEGFYKCASGDRRMESLESWLSVRPDGGNITATDRTAASSDSWIWITVLCGLLLLLLISLAVWLIHHYRYQMFCTRSCLPVPKEEPPAVGLPATKQDVTEVQWDLSWMEMTNLLDKHLYPGT